jgi:hypothetical protein
MAAVPDVTAVTNWRRVTAFWRNLEVCDIFTSLLGQEFQISTFLPGISVFSFRTTGNVPPSASEFNVQPSFQCWVLPRTTDGPFLASHKNPRPS